MNTKDLLLLEVLFPLPCYNKMTHIIIWIDPDQSIFGWRSADRENFYKMQSDFPGTVVKNLEENYRSTKSILNAAFHVINLGK